MKQIYSLITILLLTSNSFYAQTATDVVTGLSGPFGLAFDGNDLYVSEFNGNKISKIDITTTTPTATEVVTGLNGPYGLAPNGNDLYVAELTGNRISKIDNLLSVNDFSLINDIKIYPNPSDEFIHFSGLIENKKYIILNILGAEIKKGIISNNEKIDVKNLTNGLYFLKFDNEQTIKFIKK